MFDLKDFTNTREIVVCEVAVRVLVRLLKQHAGNFVAREQKKKFDEFEFQVYKCLISKEITNIKFSSSRHLNLEIPNIKDLNLKPTFIYRLRISIAQVLGFRMSNVQISKFQILNTRTSNFRLKYYKVWYFGFLISKSWISRFKYQSVEFQSLWFRDIECKNIQISRFPILNTRTTNSKCKYHKFRNFGTSNFRSGNLKFRVSNFSASNFKYQISEPKSKGNFSPPPNDELKIPKFSSIGLPHISISSVISPENPRNVSYKLKNPPKNTKRPPKILGTREIGVVGRRATNRFATAHARSRYSLAALVSARQREELSFPENVGHNSSRVRVDRLVRVLILISLSIRRLMKWTRLRLQLGRRVGSPTC